MIYYAIESNELLCCCNIEMKLRIHFYSIERVNRTLFENMKLIER